MENIVDEPALSCDLISEEEYLDCERAAIEKHEYYRGEIFDRSLCSIKHNRICTNFMGEIGIRLKRTGYQICNSNLRIHVPKNTFYTYPDISIFCSEPKVTDVVTDTVTNPSVIIEILFELTRDYDMGEKFKRYCDIDSLQEYILVDSEKIYVEKHIRNADNSWTLTENKSIKDSVFISTIRYDYMLEDIYKGVHFA